MDDFQLSRHFKFSELTGSEDHPETVQENRIEAMAHLPSLIHLCLYILEPLRVQFGALLVDSGFRGQALNAVVRGSQSSQHVYGEAADVNCVGDTSDAKHVEMAKWLQNSGIPFGQALIENGCLHVSLPGATHQGQVGRAHRDASGWHIDPLEQA